MRIHDAVINLFTRVTPMSKEDLASLKIGLANQYQGVLENLEDKNLKKKILMEKLKKELDEAQKHDEHTPEYQEHLKNYKEFSFELESLKPTFMEKTIQFFEKPMVRAVLMALFSLASYWIMKKITSPPEPKITEEEDEQQDYPNQQQYGNYPPPPPYYQPYYGYPPSNRR